MTSTAGVSCSLRVGLEGSVLLKGMILLGGLLRDGRHSFAMFRLRNDRIRRNLEVSEPAHTLVIHSLLSSNCSLGVVVNASRGFWQVLHRRLVPLLIHRLNPT